MVGGEVCEICGSVLQEGAVWLVEKCERFVVLTVVMKNITVFST